MEIPWILQHQKAKSVEQFTALHLAFYEHAVDLDVIERQGLL